MKRKLILVGLFEKMKTIDSKYRVSFFEPWGKTGGIDN
jgi:hypothetical protein